MGATNQAAADTDYSTKTGSLRFKKNEKEKTFEVAITDDNIDESDETFAVTLSKPVDNQGQPKPVIETGTAVGTITDNDDAPTALIIAADTDTGTDDDQATIAEAAGETTVRVTATITSPTRFAEDQTVTVTVGKQGDGAVEGTDYAEVADTIAITIPATEVSGTGMFDLTPVNDRITASFDLPDSFAVTVLALSSPLSSMVAGVNTSVTVGVPSSSLMVRV